MNNFIFSLSLYLHTLIVGMGFTVVFPYMHVMYFDGIYLLLLFLLPSPPLLKEF
jgi:hypothetical protein